MFPLLFFHNLRIFPFCLKKKKLFFFFFFPLFNTLLRCDVGACEAHSSFFFFSSSLVSLHSCCWWYLQLSLFFLFFLQKKKTKWRVHVKTSFALPSFFFFAPKGSLFTFPTIPFFFCPLFSSPAKKKCSHFFCKSPYPFLPFPLSSLHFFF